MKQFVQQKSSLAAPAPAHRGGTGNGTRAGTGTGRGYRSPKTPKLTRLGQPQKQKQEACKRALISINKCNPFSFGSIMFRFAMI